MQLVEQKMRTNDQNRSMRQFDYVRNSHILQLSDVLSHFTLEIVEVSSAEHSVEAGLLIEDSHAGAHQRWKNLRFELVARDSTKHDSARAELRETEDSFEIAFMIYVQRVFEDGMVILVKYEEHITPIMLDVTCECELKRWNVELLCKLLQLTP